MTSVQKPRKTDEVDNSVGNLQKKRYLWLGIGVIFHLIYLWSIFDIYFVSPLVHGMDQHKSTLNAPAKRLFLIVGDGQRADKTLGKIHHPKTGKEEYLAPYLRSIILNEGTYGLSHTRMPTESRPGHVAMIAGFYEDVSAVTKGWKENPVDFDSVFNQSTHTYSFGSPDILPMFADGASLGKVDKWMYGHEFEDFTSSSIELDKYVFNHLYQLFENSTSNEILNNEIRQDGNVFFLHLLGTDTSGHSYRPFSTEYYDNIQYTDYEISKLVPKVNEFFGDEETVFIFTADHGMSDFGSHGDGHPNNTRTPIICWGKGCNKPITINPNENEFLNDKFEKSEMENWDLDHIKRHDIKQADIAPLMSYLIGSNYPMNSVGELPMEFIDDLESSKIKGLYYNSLSLLEQYYVKLNEVKLNQFHFVEFEGFIEKSIEQYEMEILKLIKLVNEDSNFEIQAIKLIEKFNSEILNGLDYLQKYNWLMMRTIVTFGFVGWIIYSFIIFLQLFIIPHNELQNIENKIILNLIKTLFTGISILMIYIFKYQNFPINYYFYLIFPIFFWFEILKYNKDLVKGFKLFFNDSIIITIIKIISILVFFNLIAIGFEERKIFSFIYLFLSIGYPYLLNGFNSKFFNLRNFFWFLTCLLLSFFPIQNPVKTEDINLIISSGLIMVCIGIIGFSILNNKMNNKTKYIIIFQIFLILLSIYSTLKAVVSLSNRKGLPYDAQLIGWITLIISLTLPTILHCVNINENYQIRFLIIFLTFSPTFLILTISFESYFYILYSLFIYQWIEIESINKNKGNDKDKKTDATENGSKSESKDKDKFNSILRISIIGFFNLQIAFFGTGNISSISTFSLDSVYRLLPIFDPFPMGALLMVKIIIPYILLSIGLGLLNIKLNFKKYTITSLVISVCDILSLWFFFNVKIEGSWLDIGVSISNYCLAIFGALFIAIVEVCSLLILSGIKIEEFKENNLNKNRILKNLETDDKFFEQVNKIEEVDAKEGGSIGSRLRKRRIEN